MEDKSPTNRMKRSNSQTKTTIIGNRDNGWNGSTKEQILSPCSFTGSILHAFQS
jgi:hypothetical protein